MIERRLIDSGAKISDDGLYRYLLWRSFTRGAETNATMLFVMLNPSTADAQHDDPTIRRCIGFALDRGCDRVEVVNLFAYRATVPKVLREISRPIGPENDWHIAEAAGVASVIVCAWGAEGDLLSRGSRVRRSLISAGHKLFHFGLTSDGQPRHPLYVRGDTPLKAW